MRYKKVVNGNETEYYLDGSTIIAENRKVGATDNLIYYIYDMMGLSGMVYNGENYYYIKNTLGDIVGIRNSSGTQVATYSYDAWGNIISKTGTMADINPFRYRGYYYDNETGFYYSQTRYYDPSIRMFINADNYELLSTLAQAIGQLNLYAYANNNPIMYTDESGEFVFTTTLLISLGIAFFAGTGISIVSQGVQNGWDNINYLQAGVDGIFSALSVGLAYTGIGVGFSMLAGAGLGCFQYTFSSVAFGTEFTADGLIMSGVLGALGGLISGAGAQNAKALAKTLLNSTNPTAAGIISGIRSFTNGVAFSSVVNKKFNDATLLILTMTFLNKNAEEIKSLYCLG
ncbi:MAG: RHS repeat-associated core domain-containing protein [Clostridia bacterium]|nr:RHS repeat-associated core domain-containing protein [Clostridia bacterium]